MNKALILKYLRTVHSWLGIVVLPWVIVIGFTGFYLNHSGAVLSLIEPAPFDESLLADWPGAGATDKDTAEEIAAGIWPKEEILFASLVNYHDFVSYQFEKPSGLVIVSMDTGHYYVKTDYTRTTFAPDGEKLHRQIYWSRIFKELHEKGWLGTDAKRWLADATALSMIVFGMTGLFLWWMPRSRRIRRKLGFGG